MRAPTFSKSGKHKNDETKSTISKFSAFSKVAENARTEVIKEGYIQVSENADLKNPVAFTDYFTQLSKDGCLTLSKGAIKKRFIIMSCVVVDGSLFRVGVKNETNLADKTSSCELTCRVTDEMAGTDWFVSIESTLRGRLQEYKTEMDTARGALKVREIAPEETKPYSTKGMKVCECFYNQRKLRIKGIDGPQTSDFDVIKLEVNPVESSFILIVQTPGRNFFIDTQDFDLYQKWSYEIGKDLDKRINEKQVKELKAKENTEQILASEILMGPASEKMVRFKAKYFVGDHLLETADYTGNVDSFFIERAITVPSKEYKYRPKSVNYSIMFMVNMKDQESKDQSVKMYVNLSPADLKKWFPHFDVDMYKISSVLELVILQIELRRMMKKEDGTDDKTSKPRNVTGHEIFHLLSMPRNELEDSIKNTNEWSVGRLERVIQMMLKLPPEPLVPLDSHEDFIRVGKEIFSGDVPIPQHFKPVMGLISTLPHIRREILEKLTVHLYRLTQHYIKLKDKSLAEEKEAKEGKNKNTSNESEKGKGNVDSQRATKSVVCLTKKSKLFASNEVMIWNRMSKYIYRFNDFVSDDESDKLLHFAAMVLMVFQKRHVQLTSEQMRASGGSKRVEEGGCVTN